MTTWILRIDPDQFDLDASLQDLPAVMETSVRRYAAQVREGDQVFLWSGKGKAPSGKLEGIVAEAFVEVVKQGADPQTHVTDQISVAPIVAAIVRLRLARIELKARFQRNWFEYAPLMSGSMVVKSDAIGEFRLTDEEAARVNALWRRAKVNWTYAEAVAGMWAFKRTYGGQISRAPGSPVAIAALWTGRVMQGMYNKVQHFRSKDPNDTRTGLTSNSLIDREVWTRFFDALTGGLREDDIEREFARLWLDDDAKALPPQPSPEAAASVLIKLGLDQLLDRYAKGAARRMKRPAPIVPRPPRSIGIRSSSRSPVSGPSTGSRYPAVLTSCSRPITIRRSSRSTTSNILPRAAMTRPGTSHASARATIAKCIMDAPP